MADDITDFRVRFDQQVGVLGDRMDELARNVGFAFAQSVIVGSDVSPGTPVRSGFARNSWMVSLNGPGNYRQSSTKPAGDESVAVVSLDEAAASLLDMHADDVVWITSNCIYMARLEDGWSQQAPTGMIALTVAGARQIIDSVVRQMTS